jgi:hypothetical protein
MAKFLFVYRSDKDTFGTMAPEELRRFHQKWQTWIADGLQKGWILDASTALKTEGRVVTQRKSSPRARSWKLRTSSVAM